MDHSRRKVLGSEDTACARLAGEVGHLSTSVLSLQTLVTKSNVGLFAFRRAPHCHAETLKAISSVNSSLFNTLYYRFEGLDRLLAQVVLG